jgi:hypothetical protein
VDVVRGVKTGSTLTVDNRGTLKCYRLALKKKYHPYLVAVVVKLPAPTVSLQWTDPLLHTYTVLQLDTKDFLEL